ncbi:hypothetical protein [Anaeromyxobacter paludicola]|uniref:Uncharacterized protein n=1 Tax=Anaeromyxobacter paludicola TaxID=2918171 RepID=A0ABM7X7X0_9BACT|nr:hypothetical protein [Anaeromyxobacter paludicola]BDG07939.1 hypothetical protein AMPC_10520 [Anaeromyxobacter paludicola]
MEITGRGSDAAHAAGWGLLTAFLVVLGIVVGSRGLKDFDTALVPYAGATVFAAGALTRPGYLALIELAVALLVLQAIAINRLAGLDYPLWARARAPSRAPP